MELLPESRFQSQSQQYAELPRSFACTTVGSVLSKGKNRCPEPRGIGLQELIRTVMFNSLLGLLNTRTYRNKILCRRAGPGEFRVSIAPTVPTSIRFRVASMAPPRARRSTISTISSRDSDSSFGLVSKSHPDKARRLGGAQMFYYRIQGSYSKESSWKSTVSSRNL